MTETARSASAISQPPAFSSSAQKPEVDALTRAHLTRASMIARLSMLTIVLVIVAAVAAAFGSVHLNLWRAISDASSADHAIFFGARLPRVLMGIVVGAVLASVGAALQALVRNPLAEGGILGISGGGALGAIVALVLFARIGGTENIVPIAAFVVALISTVAVYRLAQV
ncbi:MAG TPA: iron chelate uptake ABC transporter family permease subunit, partial [Candidatus Binataceae bacterium]